MKAIAELDAVVASLGRIACRADEAEADAVKAWARVAELERELAGIRAAYKAPPAASYVSAPKPMNRAERLAAAKGG